jgi:exonuclease III
MVKKRLIKEKELKFEIERDETEGRWITLSTIGLLDEQFSLCGMYLPNIPRERKEWMEEMKKRMRKLKGYRVTMGDMNFVRDTRYDKIRGNSQRGTEGREEEGEWMEEMKISDVWRERNEGIIGTTWTQKGKRKGTEVKTRIE